ncbi:hypothetical protein NQ318_008013 [Aromia moschata]|uniref:PiggyBac transposable element-derived protein domain-containing protein n=1 Tax=Aromia moschata TaxID=1265417 RepID=A0AAV8XUA2_9CUCU|nr:hypothetical protein NQ318_008013 [Aromia moschata]
MNNWFSSIPLALDLKNNYKLIMLGTLKKIKEIPAELFLSSPKRKKDVLLLSTTHSDDSLDRDTGKPIMIIDYNHSKYGLDVVDQMCGTYNVSRNSRRLLLTIFFDMVNVAGINALISNDHPKQTVYRSDFLRTLALKLIKPQIRTRIQIASIPKQITERSRLFLEIQEPKKFKPKFQRNAR